LGAWLAAYLALAWALLQAVDVLGGMWGWPQLAQQAASLALGGGVLPATIVAWFHGEKGAQKTSPTEVVLVVAAVAGITLGICAVCA
jgi:hypothetical protein